MIAAQLARSDRPLIIDDAQYLLRKRMIELARDIYESCQAPVILVGEEKLPQDLTRWENIHNRQLAWEPALACNMSDARKLVPIYAAGVDVADDLLAAIVDASAGSIRRDPHPELAGVSMSGIEQATKDLTRRLSQAAAGSGAIGRLERQRHLRPRPLGSCHGGFSCMWKKMSSERAETRKGRIE